MSVIHWMKRQGPFNKQASQAKLEVVIDSLKGGHSKEQRRMHTKIHVALPNSAWWSYNPFQEGH